jgi:hypothetical protein
MHQFRYLLEPGERLLLNMTPGKAAYFWIGVFILVIVSEIANALLELPLWFKRLETRGWSL